MPNETSQQPFDQTQRNTNDTELVGQVLGSEAAREMEELTGKEDANTTRSAPASDLEISDTEHSATQKAEQTTTIEQRKQEYIEWADEYNLDADWIDESFKFNSNGTVEYRNAFWIGKHPVDRFPESLTVFQDNLSMNGCEWSKTQLEQLKKIKIKGIFSIWVEDVDDIPDKIDCERLCVVLSPEHPLKNVIEQKKYKQELIDRLSQRGYDNVLFLV